MEGESVWSGGDGMVGVSSSHHFLVSQPLAGEIEISGFEMMACLEDETGSHYGWQGRLNCSWSCFWSFSCSWCRMGRLRHWDLG